MEGSVSQFNFCSNLERAPESWELAVEARLGKNQPGAGRGPSVAEAGRCSGLEAVGMCAAKGRCRGDPSKTVMFTPLSGDECCNLFFP